MLDYISCINQIITDIETNTQLEIIHKEFRLSDAEDPEEILEDCMEMGLTISKSIVDFYLQVACFKLSWKVKPSHTLELYKEEDATIPVCGNIQISPYWQSLEQQKWENVIWFSDSPSNDEERLLRPFDYFNNDLSESACFLMDANKHIHDHLHFFSHEGGYYFEHAANPMESGLSISDYFKLLKKTRGFSIWQRIYEAQKNNTPTWNLRRYKHYMNQLFNNYDI